MTAPAVHLTADRNGVACGYGRWRSMELTSTRNPAGVTCKRPGCRRPTVAPSGLLGPGHLTIALGSS